MSKKIMKIVVAIGLLAAGYLMGGGSTQETMAQSSEGVNVLRYTDSYISLDLYTPVKVNANMKQRYHFYQMGDNKYRLNLWYNQ